MANKTPGTLWNALILGSYPANQPASQQHGIVHNNKSECELLLISYNKSMYI